VFELVVEWVYTGKYSLDEDDARCQAAARRVRATTAAQAWILGNHLGVDGFMNFAMDQLMQEHSQGVVEGTYTLDTETLKMVYTKTSEDS